MGIPISGINIDVGSVLSGFSSFVKDTISLITGKVPPEEAAKLQARAMEIEFELMKAQMEINKVEAASTSTFVAGWRPCIGWVCAMGVFYHFVGFSLFQWIVALLKLNITPPVLDTSSLLTLVFSLLGLGTLRTLEKLKGVEGNR